MVSESVKTVHAISEYETRFRFGEIFHMMSVLLMYHGLMLFTAKRLFDLPSESEMGFTVKLNTYLIIEYPVRQQLMDFSTAQQDIAIQ